MREILFKAKRLDNGAWVEGSLITYKDGTAFICCEDYSRCPKQVRGRPLHGLPVHRSDRQEREEDF